MTQNRKQLLPHELLSFFLAGTDNPGGFCLAFLIIFSGLLATSFIAIRFGFHTQLTNSPWFAKIDFPFRRDLKSSDIVVWGDSTCFCSIKPAVLQDRLRVSSLNLCQSGPILSGTGEFALDHYLISHNRPRLIVLAISPTAVSFVRHVKPEAFYLISRHGTLQLALRAIAGDLNGTLSSLSTELRAQLKFIAHGEQPQDWRLYREAEESISASDGYYPAYKSVAPLKHCSSREIVANRKTTDYSYVRHFVQKYQQRGLRVMVFFTPVPDCFGNYASIREQLRGVAANDVYTIPRNMVAVDGIHPLPAASDMITEKLAALIRPAVSSTAYAP